MNVNLAVLCDAANVSREGKLNILGEFDSIHVSTFPLVYPRWCSSCASRRTRPRPASTRLKLRLVDADGGDCVPPLQGEFATGARRSRACRCAPRRSSCRCTASASTAGHYSFELLVDGHHLRSLPLHVVADAKAKDVEVEAWHDAA